MIGAASIERAVEMIQFCLVWASLLCFGHNVAVAGALHAAEERGFERALAAIRRSPCP